ncbi:MAG TPA: hypothetical protein VI934_02165, partial [Candidatus Nanoarchaeia archaeon]|nr:hypothetical protein [Candidatus Nanoarchaeia archaeon]
GKLYLSMFLAFSWRRYDLRPALPSGPKALWGDSLLKTFYRALSYEATAMRKLVIIFNDTKFI